MSEKLFFHAYVSSAVSKFTIEELTALLKLSRANNTKVGITGMLLSKDGDFMQAVEGPETAVRGLLAKIYRDPRHRGIITLTEGFAEDRQFGEWSMAFSNLNASEAKVTEGYSEFLHLPLTSIGFTQNPTACQRLLLTFKKNQR